MSPPHQGPAPKFWRLYPKDFWADARVQDLPSGALRCAYLGLLSWAWERRAVLADPERSLVSMGFSDVDARSIWQALLPLWTSIDGGWTQPRLLADWMDDANARAAATTKARGAAGARWRPSSNAQSNAPSNARSNARSNAQSNARSISQAMPSGSGSGSGSLDTFGVSPLPPKGGGGSEEAGDDLPRRAPIGGEPGPASSGRPAAPAVRSEPPGRPEPLPEPRTQPARSQGPLRRSPPGDLLELAGPLVALDTVEFRAAWTDWIVSRRARRIRHPDYTPSGLARQLRRLAAIGLPRALAALTHSTDQEFQGIYEPSRSPARDLSRSTLAAVRPGEYPQPTDGPSLRSL